MNEWLAQQADALAAATKLPRTLFELEDADVEALLDAARIAAHTSGDRRNAPLLCHLFGVAASSGKSPVELLDVVRSTS